MYEICPETPADESEVEGLYDLCFAPGRTALSSYRLRDGVPRVADLCLLLRDAGGTLMAAIRFWPALVGDHPVLLLGPIAVHPTAQGEGLGGLLMRDSLTRARATGHDRVLLVGDAPYYGRFGFTRLDDVLMPPPTNPDRVLGLELRPGAWVGVSGPVLRAPVPQPSDPPAPDSTACTQVAPPKDPAHDRPQRPGSAPDH